MLLNRAFGINTLSLYDDNYNIGAQPDLSKVVGHLSHGMQVKQLYQRARRSDEVFFVETHERPHDDAKTIYIVRDGRAAIVSHYHYNQSFFGRSASLSDLIAGKGWPGGWSSHVDAWTLGGRPNTFGASLQGFGRPQYAIFNAHCGFYRRAQAKEHLRGFCAVARAISEIFQKRLE
jgi:hypothetical protein